MKLKNINLREVSLVRCIIIGKGIRYLKAKDYNGSKYLIVKGESKKDYSLGQDISIYAIKSRKGLLFKKTVLYPISSEQYEALLSDVEGVSGKTLKDLGLSMNSIKSLSR